MTGMNLSGSLLGPQQGRLASAQPLDTRDLGILSQKPAFANPRGAAYTGRLGGLSASAAGVSSPVGGSSGSGTGGRQTFGAIGQRAAVQDANVVNAQRQGEYDTTLSGYNQAVQGRNALIAGDQEYQNRVNQINSLVDQYNSGNRDVMGQIKSLYSQGLGNTEVSPEFQAFMDDNPDDLNQLVSGGQINSGWFPSVSGPTSYIGKFKASATPMAGTYNYNFADVGASGSVSNVASRRAGWAPDSSGNYSFDRYSAAAYDPFSNSAFNPLTGLPPELLAFYSQYGVNSSSRAQPYPTGVQANHQYNTPLPYTIQGYGGTWAQTPTGSAYGGFTPDLTKETITPRDYGPDPGAAPVAPELVTVPELNPAVRPGSSRDVLGGVQQQQLGTKPGTAGAVQGTLTPQALSAGALAGLPQQTIQTPGVKTTIIFGDRASGRPGMVFENGRLVRYF